MQFRPIKIIGQTGKCSFVINERSCLYRPRVPLTEHSASGATFTKKNKERCIAVINILYASDMKYISLPHLLDVYLAVMLRSQAFVRVP